MPVRRAAVLLAVLLLAGPGGGVATAAPGPSVGPHCEAPEALEVRYLDDVDGVQLVRNTCGLAVRSVSYSRYTTNVPIGGFPAEPKKYSRWNCGGAATGPAEVSSVERHGTWLITYAVGYQVERADGRWHTLDAHATVPDPGFVRGRPFATDSCRLDPADDDWADDLDPDFRLR